MEVDGIFSAGMLITAGTFAAPSAYAEIKGINGSIKFPWSYDVTPLSSRKTRNGKKGIPGQGHYADEMDLSIEDSIDDAQLIILKAAFAAKTKLKLVFCNKVAIVANLPVPDPAEAFIKVEFYVSDISPDRDSGKPGMLSVKLYQQPDCAEAVMVTP